MDITTSRPELTDARLRVLEEPDALRSVAEAADDTTLFNLTFHASFAVKIFDVMRREGPAVQGFDRMQQSFAESVKEVRTAFSSLPDEYSAVTAPFLGVSADSHQKLMRLIRDLARYKQWMLDGDSEHPAKDDHSA